MPTTLVLPQLHGSFKMRRIINLTTGETEELPDLPVTPLTKAEAQKKVNNESKVYLAETGWYVERLNDPSSKKAIPQKILNARAAARAAHKDID